MRSPPPIARNLATEYGQVQHEGGNANQNQSDQHGIRDSSRAARIGVEERFVLDRNRGAAGEVEHDAAVDDHRAQRDNERGNLALRNDQTVDQAADDANRARRKDRQNADAARSFCSGQRSNRHDGADGKIDRSGDDHEGHAQCCDKQHDSLLRNNHQIVELKKARRGQRESDCKRDKQENREEAAHPLAAKKVAARLMLSLGLRLYGGHAGVLTSCAG